MSERMQLTAKEFADRPCEREIRDTAALFKEASPRVSIGLPVYNGEPYLREVLDSLLAQTFTDFELIISDNASTDKTEQICREYAAKDKRIRYLRNQINLGAAENFNRVFELSRGEYFKWAAADDVCAPEFLARCVAALDGDSAAVLACTNMIDIDEAGMALRTKAPLAETASADSCMRFRQLIRWDYKCEEVFGLVRASVLRQTNLMGQYSDSDRVLLSQLGLRGHFALVPEALFLHRVHPKSATQIHATRRLWTLWFDPSADGKIMFPFWKEFIEFLRVIRQSRLPRREQLRCYRAMTGWILEYKEWLVRDLLYYPKEWVKWHVPGARVAWRWLKMIRTRLFAEGY